MIKTISKATNIEMYGDYRKMIEKVLFLFSVAGSLYSSYTEYWGFRADPISEMYPVGYPFLGIALIESSRWIIPLFFLTIFRVIRNPKEWIRRLLPFFILGSLSVALTFVSVQKSQDGNNYKVILDNVKVEKQTVDSSEYILLCQSCFDGWESDSLAAELKVKQEIGNDLQKAKQAKREANQRISELINKTASWAVKTVAIETDKKNIALGSIEDINKDIQSAIIDSLNIAKSKFKSCLHDAKKSLLVTKKEVQKEYQEEVMKQDTKVKRDLSVNNLLIHLGIFSIWIYSFFKEWLNHVSGKDVTYELDETDDNISFFQKFTTLFNASIINLSDNFLNLFWKDKTVNLKDGKVSITRNPDSEKQKAIELAKFQDEKKRLEDEIEIAEHKAALEALRLKGDSERANFQAQQEQFKTERRQAAIAIEAEKNRLKAYSTAQIKRIESEAAEKLEAEKEKIRVSDNARIEKQESDRLALAAKQLADAKAKQLAAKQEAQKVKQLADEAEKLATEKAKQETKAKQDKAKLALSMKQVNEKSETGKNAVSLEATELVDQMFAKYTKNGVLSIHRHFKVAVNNYRNRFLAATEKLKTDSLSEGRERMVKKSLNDNQVKFEYAVEKAENLGVKISVKNNEVVFENI